MVTATVPVSLLLKSITLYAVLMFGKAKAQDTKFSCVKCWAEIPIEAEPIIKGTPFGDMPVIHTCPKCGAKYTPCQSGKYLSFKLNQNKKRR